VSQRELKSRPDSAAAQIERDVLQQVARKLILLSSSRPSRRR
jgi:hypothetical protein